MNDKELEKMFGLSATEIDRKAAAYESGEWPEGETVRIGRPPTYDDDELENITFRIRKSRLLIVDRAAKTAGESRSDFLRNAVDEKLRRLTANL
jgi:hypothetical protein